ncbi:hypothetical protein D3C75_1112240 [compost metagenome]
MLKRVADCLRGGIFHSNVPFPGSIFLGNERMLTARHLGRDNLPDPFTGVIRISKYNDPSALHSQRNLGNDPAVDCRPAGFNSICLHSPFYGNGIAFAFHND